VKTILQNLHTAASSFIVGTANSILLSVFSVADDFFSKKLNIWFGRVHQFAKSPFKIALSKTFYKNR
jgi:hypothetical protein